MTDHLNALLAENAKRRAEARRQAEAEAAAAADIMDRIAHPDETDEQRQARREAEAERQRLARLGVAFK